MAYTVKTFFVQLWQIKSTLLVLLTPLVLLPLPLVIGSQEANCAYGLAIMAVFWLTEALPLAVTSLLPVVVFPLLGVMKVGDVASNYIKDTTMFSFGGLAVAIAVENCNLHKPIALRTLLTVGTEAKWLMAGFMIPTWFLSMWMSNTATTAMMIPIVDAIIKQIEQLTFPPTADLSSLENGEAVPECKAVEQDVATVAVADTYMPRDSTSAKKFDVTDEQTKQGSKVSGSDEGHKRKSFRRMCKAFCLAVSYAANCGGVGSLSGTGPNLVLQGQAEIVYARVGLENPINFVSFMIFALPLSVINLVLCWLWLQIFFLRTEGALCFGRRRAEERSAVRATIEKEYEKLGRIRFAEVAVLGHFMVLVALWLSRDPPNVSGWGNLFPSGYVGDSAAAILVCTSLFVFPSRRPTVFCCRKRGEPSGSVSPLLTWNVVHEKFPWGVLLLIGGGFALAAACEVSGLSAWIGQQLTVLDHFEPWLMNFFLTLIVAGCTEFTSNTATNSLLLPIMAELALMLSLNPLYLMLSCTLATSFAFMLPAATPPNAIVFASGHLQVKDMAIAGIGMNIIAITALTMAINTWGNAFFNLHTLPDAFNGTSVTQNPSIRF